MPTKKSDTTPRGRATPRPDGEVEADPSPSDEPRLDAEPIDSPTPDAAPPLFAETPPAASDDAPADPPTASEPHPETAPEWRAEPVTSPRPETVVEARPAYVAEPVEDEVHDDAQEEDRGWSFAARALGFLLVLLGGAALGIWGAPKLAPLLPSGLSPVAAWLTPGQTALEADIAALQARLDGEVSALNDRLAAVPDAASVQTETAASIASARTDLVGQIDALRTELAQPDRGDVDERLGRLETALDGASAELASFRDQIAAGTASLSGDAAASIDAYRAELDGLKAEVGRLSGAVSTLGGRVEEVAASAETRVTEAQAQAAQAQETAAAERDLSVAQADLVAIRAALASGQPFQQQLESLAASAQVTPPQSLTAVAATGVATPAALQTSFSDAAHQAIRASISASAGEGLMARSRAFLESQVAGRSLTPQSGATPDAVLSRAEDALRRDDVGAALTEVEQLPSEALAAMQGWIAAAKQRADAEAGLAELSSSISTLN